MTENKNDASGPFAVALTGRIDAITARQVESDIFSAIDSHPEVILDLAKVDYISSAGLRVLLSAHKRAQACGGSQTLINVTSDVREVLNMTGFSDVLNLK
jgi:anti-sigma B factor antagonist